MNQKVAKQIRKIVFGDNSQRVVNYGAIERPGKGRRKVLVQQIICRGDRGTYRDAKRFFRFARHEGVSLKVTLAAIAMECSRREGMKGEVQSPGANLS
jgi:hypothetical protein